MTAEERARGVAEEFTRVVWVEASSSGLTWLEDRLVSAIRAAEREAADEALEDAADIVEAASGDPECGCERCGARRNAVSWAAREIRARKSRSGGGSSEEGGAKP